jgi:hypothetical protein
MCERLANLVLRHPGIFQTFADVWGTDDLISSFDCINITLPINAETGRTDIEPTGKWPRE